MARLALLYLLGPLSLSTWDNNEIRYSIRSMSTINDVTWVGLTGPEKPAFLKDVHHTLVQIPEKRKFANLLIQLLEAMNDPAVPEDLVLMNDDFFMRDTPPWDWTPTHLGPVPKKLWNGWSKSIIYTGELMTSRFGVKEPLNYEGHTPMPIKKSLAFETLRFLAPFAAERSVQFRTAYGNMHKIGGNPHPNAKIPSLDKWDPSSPFMSLKATPKQELKDYITSAWPTPSRWEV